MEGVTGTVSTPYRREIPVTVQDEGAPKDVKDRLLTVELVLTTSVNPNRKSLRFQLSDDKDPFFYYYTDVAEEDYHGLKEDQRLNIEFAAFPVWFGRLLDRILSEENSDGYGCLLSIRGSAIHFLVQSNPDSKILEHLKLVVLAGNDHVVKKFLAGRLSDLKKEHENLNSELSGTRGSASETISQLQNELESSKRARADAEAAMQRLVNEHNTAMAGQTRHEAEAVNEARHQMEKERAEERASWDAEKHRLWSHTESLQRELAQATNTKSQLETELKGTRHDLQNAQAELSRYRQDVEALRADNTKLDRTKHENENTINKLRVELAALKQQVKDQDGLVGLNQHNLQSANAHKASLEESLRQQKALAEKLESKLDSATREIQKGNEIITKLQNELSSSRQKCHRKSLGMREQESQIEQLKETSAALKRSLAEAELSLKEKVRENDSVRKALDDANKQLKESEELISSNRQVIEYLSRENNAIQMSNSVSPAHQLEQFNSTFGVSATRPSTAAPTPSPFRSGTSPVPSYGYRSTAGNVGLASSSKAGAVVYRPASAADSDLKNAARDAMQRALQPSATTA